jgi:hypothetical protein
MSGWTARIVPAHIALADLYWLSYWDTMVNLDRWVIIACLDIENILASKLLLLKLDFYWLLVHQSDFEVNGIQLRVFRHKKSLFNFDKTSKYVFFGRKTHL